MILSSPASFTEINSIIENNSTFLLAGHVRPDGDAIGSTLALAASLKLLGKTVYAINEDGVPPSLAFLPESDIISLPPVEPLDIDVFFALDTANKDRLGEKTLHAASLAKMIVNIDHHISNEEYGNILHIDPSKPATGCIIYDLITSQKYPFSSTVRDALFAAISTDTGSFQYKGTSAHTFRIAADLIDRGLNVEEISRDLYAHQSRRRLELLKSLLNTLEFSENGRVAWWILTLETKEKLALLPDDSEGLINQIRNINGVDCAIFFEELKNGMVRISLRSAKATLSVCDIAQQFGGGGHPMASGIKMKASLQEAVQNVTSAALIASDKN